MDLLHGIRTFVRVVEHGSFTQAAQALGTSPATVSRQVAGLEQALSARLLQRNTRSVVVTESGLRYYEHCKQILRTVAAAAADVEDSQSHASGRLRLHAVTELGLEHLMPLLVDYLDGHPDVSVDLTLAQGTPALLEEGLDVLITLGRTLPDSTLVARDLGQVFSVVCAAPEYLARHGVPRTPEDLLRHRCLNVAAPSCPQAGPSPANAAKRCSISMRRSRSTSPSCLLPGFVAARALQEGSLLRLLPGHRLHVREVFVLYSSRRYLDAKIRTWVDFLRERLPLAFERDRAILDDRRYWAESPTGVARETAT
ncbi:LysR family transcriptional regulator [Pseudomonas aeruginosa VRFPA03]|nr:LysR family transcriptional regulator [Pseudomonas aeruginosa VRFPA03]